MERLSVVLLFAYVSAMMYGAASELQKPPTELQIFHEIAVQYKPDIHEAFNALKPAERVFLYYLYRAGLPGHYIYAHQSHRHMSELLELFEYILERKELLCEKQPELSWNVQQFNDDLLTYLVYLWTNHSQYFAKEHVHEKRTPERIQCKELTPEHLKQALRVLGYDASIEHLIPSIFDLDYEPTLCVSDDIAGSAVNIYHPAFTNADYDTLPAHKRSQINVCFDLNIEDSKRTPIIRTYKIGDMYDKELRICAYWLQKAHDHVQRYPELFDEYMKESLAHIVRFLKTGDEEDFKKHSIAWTKTNNHMDYCFGWIEQYNDPKGQRGMFQSEVTVKTVVLDKLKKLLPTLEQQLPFPDEFKREDFNNVQAIPNVSMNTILHSTGNLGPLKIVAAYCLPNYAELRSEHGAKQIMYQLTDGLGKLINPTLYKQLFHLPEDVKWLEQCDPEDALMKDLWTVHVLLHETLGHGSGRLATHIFKEGDKMTIGNVAYKVGDEIPVTSANIAEFLGDNNSLEELRAEIIALYTSIFHFDELNAGGFFKDWPARIGKDCLIEELIKEMVSTAHRHLLSQSRESNEIHGAHARANTTIMNWLLDGGGVELVQQKVKVKEKEHIVLGVKVNNVTKARNDIIALAQLVQCIKSTGDGQELDRLMKTYGGYVRDPEHRTIVQDNMKAVMGDLKVVTMLFPQYRPVTKDGRVVDVTASWPKDIVEQAMTQKYLAYSTDYSPSLKTTGFSP